MVSALIAPTSASFFLLSPASCLLPPASYGTIVVVRSTDFWSPTIRLPA